MTSTEARKALALRGHKGRAANALADHIAMGTSLTRAAKDHAVDIAAVIRLRDKVSTRKKCPCCGHVVKEVTL